MEIKKMNRKDKEDYKKMLNEILKEANEKHIQPGAVLDMKIREGLKDINLKIKEETANQYTDLFNAKIKKNPGFDLVSNLLDCGTRNSFDKTRSAFRFCIAKEIMSIVNESDKARKNKNYELMRSKTLEAYEKFFLFEREFLSDNRVMWNDISQNKKESESKRKTMKNADSIEKIFSRLKENKETYDRYSMFLSISSLVGCRPAEIIKGVSIKVVNETIAFKILGSKVGNGRGQEERVIYLDLKQYKHNEQMKCVCSKLVNNELYYKPEKKIYNGLRQYLYVQHKNFSLYTLRHRIASDLKKQGCSSETIAGFLGHRVTESQEFYGYARSSSGGVGVVRVDCSNSIKDNKSYFFKHKEQHTNKRF